VYGTCSAVDYAEVLIADSAVVGASIDFSAEPGAVVPCSPTNMRHIDLFQDLFLLVIVRNWNALARLDAVFLSICEYRAKMRIGKFQDWCEKSSSEERIVFVLYSAACGGGFGFLNSTCVKKGEASIALFNHRKREHQFSLQIPIHPCREWAIEKAASLTKKDGSSLGVLVGPPETTKLIGFY
jgi:hypothetical protein